MSSLILKVTSDNFSNWDFVGKHCLSPVISASAPILLNVRHLCSERCLFFVCIWLVLCFVCLCETSVSVCMCVCVCVFKSVASFNICLFAVNRMCFVFCCHCAKPDCGVPLLVRMC